jgi:hypothetical protein
VLRRHRLCHVEGLVRALAVVVGDEHVHGGLGLGQRLEQLVAVQQLAAQGEG